MGKEAFKITGTVEKEQMVDQARCGARQFAMLYFHFVKVLYESFGRDKAKELVQQAVFEQAVDRSDIIKQKANALGKDATLETWRELSDLPKAGWVPEWGEDHCPYAEVWRGYIAQYPWFLEFATFYCDVIDTTTIENFSGCLSHRITENVIVEGDSCRREYFESEDVKKGHLTYARKA